MTVTAHVHQPGWSPDTVTVTLAYRHADNGPCSVLHFTVHDDGETLIRQVHDVEPCAEVQPTFTLTDGECRALLEALTRHYSGTEDTRALRRDYDDERKRVDRLAEALTGITRDLATSRPEPAAQLQFHGLAAGGGACRGHAPGFFVATCPDNS